MVTLNKCRGRTCLKKRSPSSTATILCPTSSLLRCTHAFHFKLTWTWRVQESRQSSRQLSFFLTGQWLFYRLGRVLKCFQSCTWLPEIWAQSKAVALLEEQGLSPCTFRVAHLASSPLYLPCSFCLVHLLLRFHLLVLRSNLLHHIHYRTEIIHYSKILPLVHRW